MGDLDRLDVVVEEVRGERLRQNAKWGGPEHDDQHDRDYWARMIGHRAGQVEHLPDDPDEERRLLIEVAALAVARVESIDREHGRPEAPALEGWAMILLADGNAVCTGCGCLVHQTYASEHRGACGAGTP